MDTTKHGRRSMSVFKLTILDPDVGKVGLGFESDVVELAGEWVEWAKWRDVEQKSASPPHLTFKGAF